MYQSYLEIAHQSDALTRTWEAVWAQAQPLRAFFERPGDVVFVACGSSYWLSLSAHKSFQLATGRRAFAVKAGDVVLNPEEYAHAYDQPILVLPSRSGTTSEQLEAIRLLREAYGQAPVLSFIEYEHSPLSIVSDLSLTFPWANEISVCQTRSFSSLYLALIALSSLWSDALRRGMEHFLEAAPALEARDFPRVEAIAQSFAQLNHVIALGSGRQYGVAIEGAYICVEMAQQLSSYYGMFELRHGPIVTVNDQALVAVCSMGPKRSQEEQVAREAVHYGARALAVVAQGGFESAEWVFSLDDAYPPEAVALHYVFVMQALAYSLAVARGLDPDHPGDLVPYIELRA